MKSGKRWKFADVQSKVLIVALGLLAVASIVTAAFNVPPEWQTPLVLTALLAIILLLTPVEEIHSDVRFLRAAATSVKVERFPNVDEFYAQLGTAIKRAASTVDLSHIRDEPPREFGGEAAGWTDSVAAWLEAAPGRSVRRVIAIRSQAMREWALELHQQELKLPGYHVHVVDWVLDAPALNMVIIDSKVVFLAITGATTERTKALGIEDEVSGDYFSSYYQRLFDSGTPLAEWLAADR
jgi:hypothetical protein